MPDWVDFIVKVRHNSIQHPLDTQRRIFSTAPLDPNGDPRYSASYGTSVVTPLVTAEFDLGNPDPTVTNGQIRGKV